MGYTSEYAEKAMYEAIHGKAPSKSEKKDKAITSTLINDEPDTGSRQDSERRMRNESKQN